MAPPANTRIYARLKCVQEHSSAEFEYAQGHVSPVSMRCSQGQGGYETLCVVEGDLQELKKMNADVRDLIEIAVCSDAGSGYKATQYLNGMRNAKEHTGVRVRHLHFNASGEGKRWEARPPSPVRLWCVSEDGEVPLQVGFFLPILKNLD